MLNEAYAELPAFPPLAFAGCMDDSFMDAARVTHSFLRAHGGWLRQRFPNLPLDPQRRYGRKYFFCAHGLDVTASGASAGAALTGEDAMHAHVPYVQRATDSRWNLCRLKGLSERQVAASFDLRDGLPVSVLICVNTVNFARLLLLRQCAEHIYVTGQATISGKGFRSHSSIHTDERHYGCILRGDHQLTILPLWATGAIMPVVSYREKLLAMNQVFQEDLAGATPHVCVPAASVVDGVLVDRDDVTVTGLKEGGDKPLLGYSQVRVYRLCPPFRVVIDLYST